MSAAVLDFLTDLRSDPAKHRQLKDAPREIMSETGMTDAEQEALLSGDVNEVRRLLGQEGPYSIAVAVAVTISFYKPEK